MTCGQLIFSNCLHIDEAIPDTFIGLSTRNSIIVFPGPRGKRPHPSVFPYINLKLHHLHTYMHQGGVIKIGQCN